MRSLAEILRTTDNDFSMKASRYRATAAAELAGTLRAAPPRSGVRRSTLSVIVPAYNASSTVCACLASMAHSSLNRRDPSRLEVIVVDDGSHDDTWAKLQSLNLPLRLECVRQANAGRAAARNLGLRLAQGDVVVFCDADVILGLFALEELANRHDHVDEVLLVGFRAEITAHDPLLDPERTGELLLERLVPFWEDERITTAGAGWPESICGDTGHLAALGFGRSLLLPDGDRLDLPVQAYTALCSIDRGTALRLGGFDERLRGWGFEDTLFAARALAIGHCLVPVYSACGLHVTHPPRSANKWREYAWNGQTYRTALRAPLDLDSDWVSGADGRIRARHSCRSSAALGGEVADRVRGWHAEPRQALARGRQLALAGAHLAAAEAFAEAASEGLEAGAVLESKALAAAGDWGRAEGALQALAQSSGSARAWAELALLLAEQERSAAARDSWARALAADPDDALVSFLRAPRLYDHGARERFYHEQGLVKLAERHRRALLITDTALGRSAPRPGSTMLDSVQLTERALMIPGFLSRAGASALLEQCARVLAPLGRAERVRLIDVGSYCGQVTVLLAHGFSGRFEQIEIAAIDDPDLPAPEIGQAPREIFETQMMLNRIPRVTRVPEECPVDATEPGALVFLNLYHCPEPLAVLERSRRLCAPGGVIVAHAPERVLRELALGLAASTFASVEFVTGLLIVRAHRASVMLAGREQSSQGVG